jgi:predicted nucleotidyltransferase
MSGIENELQLFFLEHPENVFAVYLFGSRARKDNTRGSDVDVGVLFETPPPARLDHPSFGFADALEARLGVAVDVVEMNTAPVDLIHRILRDGKLVLDRDPSQRIAFEVQARNDYFDLVPILECYRRTPESKPTRAPGETTA